jgi:alginate O-acetyltransferase complex protein AlgI
MLFYSQQFLAFFTIVFFAYWVSPWHRCRIWLLLAASFFFYASWNKWLALLIGVSTTMDFLIARGLDAGYSPRWRKALLAASLTGNIGLLCYFKYANFFLQSIEQSLHALGASTSIPTLRVILPVGISFYTFEAISYTVDVYRRRIPAERSLVHFMLFITFFPHLVAGPVVRARDFLPQIRRRKVFNWARLQLGMHFFLIGLFKKLAIADHLAQFVDPVFADPTQFRSHAVWEAVLAYGIQIYCDFSGYSDMAIGLAHMLGFKLPQNFRMPYLSCNVAEFWRRWHISLSSWLRDYLYIPLGGSECDNWKISRNLMVTMALGGLWHGSNWTFVAWGVVHGVLLIVHRWFRRLASDRPVVDGLLRSVPGVVARVLVTFVVVNLAWVLFRAPTFVIATEVFWGLAGRTGPRGTPIPEFSLFCLTVLVVIAHGLGHSEQWGRWFARLPSPVHGLAYATVFTLTQILAPQSEKAFIYFQF